MSAQQQLPSQNCPPDTDVMPVSAGQQQQPPHCACGDATKPTYSDRSGAVFSMYIDRARAFDNEDVENWEGGADSILVFTGIFSSTVATFIAISYQNLQQDPNVITQSLLAQISQQLSNATTSPAASPSTQSSFSPSAPVVFINSVWFLSLVLSLTCALMATLLQQWARRYRQIIQRNHAPDISAHIREYFYLGARKFRITGLVEALPFLLLLSVFLFFAGIVVFAFLANHIVAYVTLGIVGFCFLSYIALTLMPLIFHDCPYYTPFTSLLWYSAHILPFSILSFLYHCAHQMHKRWGTVGESMVKLFHHQQKTWSESFSRGMTSTLVNSAKRPSVYIYKQVLEGTLQWLRDDNNDEELEKFVTGIPGLFHYISPDDKGPHHPIRDVLAALPGPSSIHNSLPWGIMELAQRTVASSPTKLDKKQRTQACFRALYHIPGAIRDLLAPYAANEHLYMNILPLLDSPESLEVIKELWNATDNNVVLSVRCALAARVAFRITPPSEPDPLDSSTTPRRHSTEFFPRLGISAVADSGAIDPQSDTPLQNLVRFLGDITDGLQEVHKKQWMSDNADSIRRMRRELFDTRHVKGYGNAHKSFNQEGDRESPVFVPAAQQDLITLTLEVLARSVMKDTPKSALQDRGFPGAWHEFVEAAFTKALEGTGEDALKRAGDQARVPPASVLRTLARIRVQAADSFEMAERALRPVLDSFGLEVTMTKRHYVTEA